MANFKFDSQSAEGRKLVKVAFEKMQELLPNLELDDDSVAEFSLAVAASGASRAEVEAGIAELLEEDTAKKFVSW